MIGVRFESPGKALRKQMSGIAFDDCSIVVSVLKDGPGYTTGIEDYDLITAIDGDPKANPAAIRKRIAALKPGDCVLLSVRRGTATMDVSLVSVPWKHVPIPMEANPMPIAVSPSPVAPPTPGTPNAPADVNAKGRPAASPQRTAGQDP